MDNDEDVAELLERDGDAPARFGLRGWTHERELLTTVADRVAQLNATLIAVNSEDGKGPDIDPLPRPSTAVERAEHRALKTRHKALVSKLLPDADADE